jgi:hypothetical protein
MADRADKRNPTTGNVGEGSGSAASDGGDTLPNGDSAAARGTPEPGQGKMGWGAAGQNYPPTQGPMAEKAKPKSTA